MLGLRNSITGDIKSKIPPSDAALTNSYSLDCDGSNDYMIFTFPDNETFMPNKIQLTEEEFNQEVGSNESNFALPSGTQ